MKERRANPRGYMPTVKSDLANAAIIIAIIAIIGCVVVAGWQLLVIAGVIE